MFLLLALLIQSRLQQNVIKTAKQIAIQSNVNTIVDTFEGVVLNERIEFDEDFKFTNPCKITQQPVRFSSKLQEATHFKENFINGTLQEKLPQFVTIAQVGLGVMVLMNTGELLFYIGQERNYVLRSSYKYPKLCNTSKAIIELIDEKLIILTDQGSWLLVPDFSDENIFENKVLSFLEISNNPIRKSQQVDDYLYILDVVGLNVFKFVRDQLILILEFRRSIQDFQVIKMNSYHYVLYLEKNQGLQFSQFNLTTNSLNQISEINLLYNVIQGDAINIYKNRLLVINNNFTQESCISLFIFDIQESTLNKIGTQHIPSPILRVLTQEDVILIFGPNVHYTINWSIFYNPKLSKSTFVNQFVIPGLRQQFLKINERKKNLLMGITNSTFVVFEIEQQKAYLECLVSSQYPEQFSFNYYVKTTNCKEQQNLSLGVCSINNTYHMNVLYSTKYSQESLTTLYLGYVGVILNFALICIFVQQYLKYRKLMSLSQNGFDELEYDSQKSSTVRQKKSQVPEFEKDIHAPKASRTPDPISPIIIVSDTSSN